MENNWLVLIKHLPGIQTSQSFIKKFDSDLQNEFKVLTGKSFDGSRFYLFIEDPTIEYFQNVEVPFARLKGVLMLTRGRIEANIVWFDKIKKQLIVPSDDVSNSNTEFHWENLKIDADPFKLLPN